MGFSLTDNIKVNLVGSLGDDKLNFEGNLLVTAERQKSNLIYNPVALCIWLVVQRGGGAIWGGAASSVLERVRCLACLKFQESYQIVFTELKIFTVVPLYIQENILHTMSATPPRHQDIHSYNPRNSSDFALPAHHLSLYSKK